MRIVSSSRDHFYGTHKGAHIHIEKEPDGQFYIIVTSEDGGALYDGWSPAEIRTMREAKREALRGAGLASDA